MSIQSGSQTVLGVATPIVEIPSGQVKTKVKVCNYDGGSIYLGGKGVSAAGLLTKGIPLAANAVMEFELSGGDILYGVSAATLAASVTAIKDEGEVAVTAVADDGYCSITAITSDGTTVTVVGANNYVAGDHVSIWNATEPTFNLVNALIDTASGTGFTVLSAAAGATSTADAHTLNKLNTITYTATNTYNPADVVTVELATSAGYNIIGGIANTASGSQFTIQKILNVVGTTSIADARLTNGNLVTYTAANTFVVGDLITITLATSSEYNVTSVITTRSSSQFTFVIPVLTGVTSTATATRVGTAAGAVAVIYSA